MGGARRVPARCANGSTWAYRVPVAINCSGKELLHGDPARVVESEAAAAGVPTSLIEIEITEIAAGEGLLRECRAPCRSFASSAAGSRSTTSAPATPRSPTSRRFPPDRIKIDKALRARCEIDSAGDAAIANAILSLAASLDISPSRPKAWSAPASCSGCAIAAATKRKGFPAPRAR